MLAVAFDTLKLARKLESAGMASKQAQDTSAALSETYTEWLSLGNVATREDVQKLEQKLDVGIAATKAEVQQAKHELETKISSLDTKIATTKYEILRWMFAQTIVMIGTLLALTHNH
jgi:predicted amino acid-binding ACT domain protein